MAAWRRARSSADLKAPRLVAAFSLVFVLALAAVYGWVGDRSWWGEAVVVWPPLLWGTALTAMPLTVWLLGARRSAAMVLAAILIFVGISTEWPRLSSPPAGARSSRSLRVVTWNVSRMPLFDVLAPLHPDLCLLQESVPPRQDDRDHPVWTGFTWVGGDDPGVWSRHPVRALPTERIGPWAAPLILRVETPVGGLLVIDVRLVLPSIVMKVASPDDRHDLRAGHRARVAQFTRLAQLIDRARAQEGLGSVLLCGDFNAPGGLPSLSPLRQRLRDVWKEGGVGWGATMGSDLPVSRIDQCWVSPDIEVVEARVLPGRASDHRLLLVDLRLPAMVPP